MTPQEYLVLQIVLDALLFLLVLFLLWRFRKIRTVQDLDARLAVLEKLSADLARYVEEEKRLYERLRRALEAGARAWEHGGRDRGRLREEVLRAWREGGSVSEIARKFSLSEGEVELLISLERFKENA
ncbi:hypothetical protein [Thermosulfurimonas sp. F29]|uniref:hypothetical protein n=1 Tax=Thermosulfurimonas sp. F29 TaxID=2867247 RepID=UPI001C83CB0A|nr:hypothetical protein [Thermosulfurimonas sp. F29]MBX6423595.1 hypothetical protein [Thermosulfurimonas sp. F29]